MKPILTFLFLLFFASTAFAQADTNKALSRSLFMPPALMVASVANKPPVIRICTPSRSSLMAPPLMVVFSHDRVIYRSLAAEGNMSKLSPDCIKSIYVLKDSSSVAKYGSAAKNGVIEIYIDDEKYPDAYKVFKTDSLENKKR